MLLGSCRLGEVIAKVDQGGGMTWQRLTGRHRCLDLVNEGIRVAV